MRNLKEDLTMRVKKYTDPSDSNVPMLVLCLIIVILALLIF